MRRAFLIIFAGFCCALTLCASPEAQDVPDSDDALAKSILEKADQVRFPAQGFEVLVTIATNTSDGSNESRKYRVLSKGNENTLIFPTHTASARGHTTL